MHCLKSLAPCQGCECGLVLQSTPGNTTTANPDARSVKELKQKCVASATRRRISFAASSENDV